MRVSTKSLQLQWLADVYRRQAEIARVQKQVTSGLRISTASDDPAGAGQVVSLNQGLDRLGNYGANAEAARRRLALEENALDKFGDALARVRELTVQAGGGIQTPDTRAAIATEIRELLASMVDIANSQDGEGRYLFGGNEPRGEPVTVAGDVVTYNGDDGTRLQRIGDSRTIREGDPGSEVFFAIRNGNGTFYVQDAAGNGGTGVFAAATVTDAAAWVPDDYAITFTAPDTYEVTDSAGNTLATGAWSSGQPIAFQGVSVTIEGAPVAGDFFRVRPAVNRSVFQTMVRLAGGLESDSASPVGRADFQNMLNATLLNLDQVERHLGKVRGSVGARLAAVDEQQSNNEELALQLQSTLSSVRDVDYAAAISDLETELTGLEAAQKVFAQTRGLSLFDLL
jgi:flagellar hook-associated protein 3 FlgL